MSADLVVAVPAEIEVAERLAGPLTVRMAGWLALAALGATAAGVGWPAPAPSALGLVLLMVGASGAWAAPGGRFPEAWLLPLTGFLRRARHGRTTPTPPIGSPTRSRSMRHRVRLSLSVPGWPGRTRWRRASQLGARGNARRLSGFAVATVLTGFVTLDVAVFTVDALHAPGTGVGHDDGPGALTPPTAPSATSTASAASTASAPAPFILLLPGAGTP